MFTLNSFWYLILMSWWTPCSLLMAPWSVGKKSKRVCKMYISKGIQHPIFWCNLLDLYSFCIAVIHIQPYIYTCRNKINNNDERIHFFRKIYLSNFIRNGCEMVAKWLRKGCERVISERWVGDWTNCNILTPSSFVFSSTSFSFCWAAQSGVLMAHGSLLGAGSLYSILSPINWFQLNEPVCRTGLYNYLTSTCFLWPSHLHPIQSVHSQGYTLISSTGCTCFSIDGWIEGQYVTYFSTLRDPRKFCTTNTNERNTTRKNKFNFHVNLLSDIYSLMSGPMKMPHFNFTLFVTRVAWILTTYA